MAELFILRHPETEYHGKIMESKLPLYEEIASRIKKIAGNDLNIYSSPIERAIVGAKIFTNKENIHELDFLALNSGSSAIYRTLELERGNELADLCETFYKGHSGKRMSIGPNLNEMLKPIAMQYGIDNGWALDINGENTYNNILILGMELSDNTINIPVSFAYNKTDDAKGYAKSLFYHILETKSPAVMVTHMDLFEDVPELFDKPIPEEFGYFTFFNSAYHVTNQNNIISMDFIFVE